MVETDHTHVDEQTERVTFECDWPDEGRSAEDIEDIALPLRNAVKSLHKSQYKDNGTAYYDQALGQLEIAMWLIKFNRDQFTEGY